MRSVEGQIRPSVMVDALLISSVPLALNVLRLIDSYGSKLPAVLLLLLMVFKNLVLLPGSSLRYQKAIYSSRLDERFDKGVLLSLFLFLLLTAVAVVRGLGVAFTFSNVLANIALLIVGFVAIVSAFLNAGARAESMLLLKSAAAGMVLLVVANVVVFAVGFRGVLEVDEDRLNQTLALMGITTGRVLFPLTFGTNAFGSIAALAVLCSAVLFSGRGPGGKIVVAASGLCCTAALIAVDSRAAIIGLVLVFVWLGLLRWRRGLSVVPLVLVAVSPIAPFLMSWFFSLANQAGLFSALVRSGSQGARLGVGTGRGYIWASAGQELADAKFMHLIGYGSYGQISSKFSSAYSWIFNQLGQTGSSVHNATLQAFFDMGYIGTAAWIVSLWTVTRACRSQAASRSYRGTLTVVFASLFFLILQAQTEVVATIYAPELLYFYMVVCIGVSSLGMQLAAVSNADAEWYDNRAYRMPLQARPFRL